MLSTAGVVADCSLHRTSAIQDLQVLAGAQQRSASAIPWSCGRLFLTLHRSAIQDLQVLEGAQQRSAALELWQIAPYTARICHPGPAGPGRSSAALGSTGVVADCSFHRSSCHPGAAGPGRSSTVLSAAGAVADCSLHHRSAIQDLQVLEGAQQRWPCGRLFLTPQHLPSRTCRSWKELSSARQPWSCGRLLLTPHICHPGPAGPGRSSTAQLLELWQIVPYTTDLPSRTCRSWQELSSTGAVADCSLHRSSAIQDLQVLTGDQKCSAMLELWQSLPHTTNLPSRTCRSWMELSSAQQC